MVFGTPISWFIAEILSMILFILCIVHAARQEHGIIRILESFGFLIYSAIYENIGVYTTMYNYDLHRIMMIGKVPVEILLIEAVTLYACITLADKLHIPAWGKPFVVGFLTSIQDMTLDPASVYDRHLFNGVLSGQWNWQLHYSGTFFGIPFFNFSGWLYMMGYYVLVIELGKWWLKKSKKEIVGYIYPILSTIAALLLLVSPVTRFALFGMPFYAMYTRGAELVLLIVNYAVSLFILIRYLKIDQPFDFKRDFPVFVIPIALHGFDILVTLVLQLKEALIPVCLVSLVHIAFLIFVYLRGKRVKANPNPAFSPAN
jgi:uncharacterized membrane protein